MKRNIHLLSVEFTSILTSHSYLSKEVVETLRNALSYIFTIFIQSYEAISSTFKSVIPSLTAALVNFESSTSPLLL